MPLLLLPYSAGGNVAFPDLYLEVAFTTNPGEPPVWERIPLADIRSIDINRGRSRELDQFQAGRMTVVLDNRDRLYDPQYSAGSHFGDVLPNRRIHLIVVWDTSYYLFSGYLDNWAQNWDKTNEATVVVTATDGFKVLARADLPTSAYAAEVQKDSPAHWWRLGEAVGATTAFDSAGSADMTASGSVTFGATSLVTNDTNTAATFTLDSTDRLVTSAFASPTGTGGFTIEFVLSPDNHTNSSQVVMSEPSGTDADMFVEINNTENIDFGVGPAGRVSSLTSLTVGTAHHVAVRRDASGGLTVFINGVDNTDAADTDSTSLDAAIFYVGHGPNNQVGNSFGGTIDEVAIYDYALTDVRIAAHADAFSAPWDGDTSGERIERLLDLIGWPDADRDVDTGDSTLDSANLNMSALAHAQLVTDSEYGELWITPDGLVKFLSRTNKLTLGTPEATFSDDGADTGYTQLGADYSDQQIRNRVTIARAAGLSFTANSTGSQDQFFIQSYSKTGLVHDSDIQSRDQANYIMNVYDQPLFRFDDLTVRPQKTPATWFPVVLGLDLVDRVNVERTPQDVGTAIDSNFVIEGVRHTIRPKLWETTYYVSPADTPGAFILDSTSQGILDTNRLGF